MAHILIIDDDNRLRQLLRLILGRSGHTTVEACDGDAALSACASEQFDLALCDILMPGREGLETIRELRQRFPNLRVIAMSGGLGSLSMDPLRIATFLGACRTLPKPFRIEQLLTLVNEALTSSPLPDRTPLPVKRSVDQHMS
jgi:DNA-binding NtrC family response regulator